MKYVTSEGVSDGRCISVVFLSSGTTENMPVNLTGVSKPKRLDQERDL
jgi:hypothetical protein